MMMVGAAIVARVARDARAPEAVIVIALALAVAAAASRESWGRSLARLAAWDKAEAQRELRSLKRRLPQGS